MDENFELFYWLTTQEYPLTDKQFQDDPLSLKLGVYRNKSHKYAVLVIDSEKNQAIGGKIYPDERKLQEWWQSVPGKGRGKEVNGINYILSERQK